MRPVVIATGSVAASLSETSAGTERLDDVRPVAARLVDEKVEIREIDRQVDLPGTIVIAGGRDRLPAAGDAEGNDHVGPAARGPGGEDAVGGQVDNDVGPAVAVARGWDRLTEPGPTEPLEDVGAGGGRRRAER